MAMQETSISIGNTTSNKVLKRSSCRPTRRRPSILVLERRSYTFLERKERLLSAMGRCRNGKSPLATGTKSFRFGTSQENSAPLDLENRLKFPLYVSIDPRDETVYRPSALFDYDVATTAPVVDTAGLSIGDSRIGHRRGVGSADDGI
uniref:Uncharacterized protein n=1 Tax=Vespula pensylvanica TaxID=30213 RepID=A0A834NAJ7_VESPE|nr:hypothetical protein H0235_015236 [Vespula pensylvanica]